MDYAVVSRYLVCILPFGYLGLENPFLDICVDVVSVLTLTSFNFEFWILNFEFHKFLEGPGHNFKSQNISNQISFSSDQNSLLTILSNFTKINTT